MPDRHALLQGLTLPCRKAGDLLPAHGLSLRDPGQGLRRDPACEAVPKGGAEGIDIGPGAQLALVLILLEGGEAVLDHGLGGVAVAAVPGGTEVQEPGPAVGEDHDIVRADVPVDDVRLMDILQGLHDGLQQLQQLLRLHGAGAADPLRQGLAMEVLHDDIGGIVLLEAAADMDHRRLILEFGQGPGFPQEPGLTGGILLPDLGGIASDIAGHRMVTGDHKAGVVLLDRHRGLQIGIPAQVSDAKAALAQHPAHHILAPEHRAHGELMRLVVLIRRPAAVLTEGSVGHGHTAGASPLLHVFPLFFGFLYLIMNITGGKG